MIGIVLTLTGGWLIYNLIDKVGVLISDTSGRFQYRYEMLRSITVAVAKVSLVIGTILVLAEVLGLPYEGVVAGLGIGGITVALAAQSTIANFIGGLTLLADKPVQVGDFCRFGDNLGTIEGLGLRSVKVRSLDRTLYTIPNAEFVNLYLENFSRRDSILLKTVLQLRDETTPDQLRWVLARIRKLLLQHPRVLAEPSRAVRRLRRTLAGHRDFRLRRQHGLGRVPRHPRGSLPPPDRRGRSFGHRVRIPVHRQLPRTRQGSRRRAQRARGGRGRQLARAGPAAIPRIRREWSGGASSTPSITPPPAHRTAFVPRVDASSRMRPIEAHSDGASAAARSKVSTLL